jgi:hypothetical protein
MQIRTLKSTSLIFIKVCLLLVKISAGGLLSLGAMAQQSQYCLRKSRFGG